MIEFMAGCIIVVIFIYLLPQIITLVVVGIAIVVGLLDGIIKGICDLFRRQE